MISNNPKYTIFIPKGATVFGVILVDSNQNPIAGFPIPPLTPKDGDILEIEFFVKPEKVRVKP